MADVYRHDFRRFSKVERTPQGGMRIPANLTRTGIFRYVAADGSEVRELRPQDEVFHADSLATLAGATVTDLHPAQPVGPTTYRKVSVGHVSDMVKQDGAFVAAHVLVQDADTIAAVERGERKEVSCGYRCRIDKTAGEYEGERYDAVQRHIRYNHVALGPEGWGRAGTDVALRLDSTGNQITTIWEMANGSPSEEEESYMQKYTIDGVTYDMGSPEFAQALTRQEEKREDAFKQLQKEHDSVTAERDAFQKECVDLKAKLKESSDPVRLDALVTERVQLHDNARRILGTSIDFAGKTSRDVMIMTIRHDDKDFEAEGKSDDYVKAYFDAITQSSRRHDEGGRGIGAIRSAVQQTQRIDASDDLKDQFDAMQARKRMLEYNRTAAEQPLRFSRKA